MKTVQDIVKEYLVNNSYDGLYNPDGECACEISCLRPCDGDFSECIPGYKQPCTCGEHDWHIGRRKPVVATKRIKRKAVVVEDSE